MTNVDRFVLEGFNSLLASNAAKFTVKPGDVFSGSSGERSEVVLGGWQSTSRFKVNGNEGVEYYRVSVKLSPDWISPQTNAAGSRWGTFFQAHGPDEYAAPPAISINVDSKFSLFVLGGDMSKKVGGTKSLTKSSLNAGKWVDFVLKIKWASDATGAVTVYRRDEGETAWNTVADITSVPTLQYLGTSGVKQHYWKAGLYRSESSHTNSLTLGSIIRAKTFAEASSK